MKRYGAGVSRSHSDRGNGSCWRAVPKVREVKEIRADLPISTFRRVQCALPDEIYGTWASLGIAPYRPQ
jgi:hypothetical protein